MSYGRGELLTDRASPDCVKHDMNCQDIAIQIMYERHLEVSIVDVHS